MMLVRDVIVALTPSILAVFLKFFTLALTDPNSIDWQLIGIGHELPLVALGLITGAAILSETTLHQKARFVVPLILSFIIMIIVLVCTHALMPFATAKQIEWIVRNESMCVVWIPNLLGLYLVGYAVRAMRQPIDREISSVP